MHSCYCSEGLINLHRPHHHHSFNLPRPESGCLMPPRPQVDHPNLHHTIRPQGGLLNLYRPQHQFTFNLPRPEGGRLITAKPQVSCLNLHHIARTCCPTCISLLDLKVLSSICVGHNIIALSISQGMFHSLSHD